MIQNNNKYIIREEPVSQVGRTDHRWDNKTDVR